MKKEYEHPIYGNGLAPMECVCRLALPPHWKRGARRRFEKSCKEAGLFYYREGNVIALAFESKKELDFNIEIFKKQLEINDVDFKIK